MSSDGSRCHDRAYRLIVSPNCVKGRSDISRRMSAVFTSMIGEPVPVSADLLVPASFRVNKHSLLARRCDSTPQSYTTSRNAREIQLPDYRGRLEADNAVDTSKSLRSQRREVLSGRHAAVSSLRNAPAATTEAQSTRTRDCQLKTLAYVVMP